MKIKCMKLGYHSSNYLCVYCKRIVSKEESKYCLNNVISIKYYTIIPSFEDMKNTFLNFFDKPYYKKIE